MLSLSEAHNWFQLKHNCEFSKQEKRKRGECVAPQVEQVKDDVVDREMAGEIIAFCAVPRTQNEIFAHLGLTDRKHLRRTDKRAVASRIE